ncbi:succinyl-3-ketoacid-coenzyme a transferase [Pyrenophora seminiperda CCB06]|uniref:Succinyl-3-ketoacid-coenzyme a transferase n=1 Tax=Pyrenophora seminiperda CCB06 TaxID=1302712 RepID=A0A3M7M877_9PLEO|nr:succinyl-3-ketoacid-coenzyme a transferase [Pyrenophora seminiperda CCB06]
MLGFDPSSGLVYRETTSYSVRSMQTTWASQSRGKRVNPSIFRPRGQGCATLQSMALRACLWNIDNMEPEALQWLTWTYARLLYDDLKSNDTLTFKTWSLFQNVFPNDIDQHAKFRVCAWINNHASFVVPQLSSIVDRLSRLDVSMLTFLSINGFELSSQDLASLSKIKTLAVLALAMREVSDISADPIRNWARSVHESDAFQKLRVLIFESHHKVQRDSLLKNVSSFKLLNMVGIYDHRKDPDTIGDWVLWSNRPPEQCQDKRRFVNIDLSSIQPEEGNPMAIWDDYKVEEATRMRQLYDLSLSISQGTPEEHAYRSLAMTYYATENYCNQLSGVRWLFRERKDVDNQVIKRPRSEDTRREGLEKKRKLRDGKKVDVGSLLGSFG